jgi:hypothetical protein
MIIFQTAGGGTGWVSLDSGLLAGRSTPECTTFQTNDYIHKLNRTLQAEMRAVSAYGSLAEVPSLGLELSDVTAGHQHAGKELVRLIIANRGIPEDKAGVSLGLTKTFVQLCAAMPKGISGRATRKTLLRLEHGLGSSYRKLLKLAPARDVAALTELLAQTEKHKETVTKLQG